MPTAVPTPTFGKNGIVVPDEQDLLDGRLSDFNAAFGGGLDTGLSTPQGQLSSSDAAILGDAYAIFAWLMNMVDPAFSEGRMQDGIGRIYAINRIAGTSTVVTATCIGLENVTIPAGALAQATDGNLYVCLAAGKIPNSGSIDLPFGCQTQGPISCPAHTLTKIYTSINGWDTIDNAAAGTAGRDVEGRFDFEARRRASVGWQSNGPLGAVRGAVLGVTDVLDAVVLDNPNGYASRQGDVTLAANSIYVCVLGGADEDIGLAILRHKAPGVPMTGNTVVTIEDPNPDYLPPRPTYDIRFQRPDSAFFSMRVAIKTADDIPSDAEQQIRDAVIPVFMGRNGNVRERIGSTIYASRYYPIIEAIGPWAKRLISVDLSYGTEVTFTGAIVGAILKVSSISSGILKVGQVLHDDDGLSDGVKIIGYELATGGVGDYLVEPAVFVAERTMYALKSGDRITLGLNEAPLLDESSVKLVLE